MNKTMSLICDIFIILAAISLVVGIISRILVKPFPFGIEAQAYLQFSHGLLLFEKVISSIKKHFQF